jgi:hypothetical protein
MKTPTCCICGREIAPGQKYETSKPRKRPVVFVHKDCIKKKEVSQ